jgi:hypothetical protein
MIQRLHEIVGMPSAATSTAIAQAADRYSENLFSRATGGDSTARRALIELKFAYLVWAYAKPAIQRSTTSAYQVGA